PHCTERIDVFSTGGGKRTADEMKIHFLGELPLDPQVRVGGDSGQPVALLGEGDEHARGFLEIARRVVARIEQTGQPAAPTISITD
ncbi:MAG: Mrp/NBP35 family ATP-binding protein, partial [Acidobacteriota bacterium]|nr:Mrp/NBP35 family ATP-binding protein [Acidobacteriota bacterium]